MSLAQDKTYVLVMTSYYIIKPTILNLAAILYPAAILDFTISLSCHKKQTLIHFYSKIITGRKNVLILKQ